MWSTVMFSKGIVTNLASKNLPNLENGMGILSLSLSGVFFMKLTWMTSKDSLYY